MNFSDSDLSLIGRALLDAAGKLKVELGRMCEAEPYYDEIHEKYSRTVELAKRMRAEWEKRTAPGEDRGGEA